jgi:hypothetical protein
VTARLGLALTALLLAVLAYGMASGVGTGAPAGYAGADCFHVDADGVFRDCADAEGRAATAAVQAANWTWWGAAASPIALAGALLLFWRRLRRRSERQAV